jgi:acyl carrier protein
MPQVLVSTGGWVHQATPPGDDKVGDEGRDRSASDRGEAALPLNPRPSLASPYVAPDGEIPQRICDVWRDALGVYQIGMDDSFFDLGGHSLLAIQVMARLNADFGTAIPVAKLYEGLTPSFLAELVRKGRPAGLDEPVDGDERQERQKRQKRHQEKRRVARTGQGRFGQ